MHVTADVFRCQRVKKLSAVNRKLFRIQTQNIQMSCGIRFPDLLLYNDLRKL